MEAEISKVLNKGEKFKIIPIDRLKDLKSELDSFRTKANLNGFQKWIVDDLYNLTPPESREFKSIILVAVPHPLYANVELKYNNRIFITKSIVMSDFSSVSNLLEEYHRLNSYSLMEAGNIPLKRLAVHSGFAKYGRNNICYIDGLGSLFSFIAFFSGVEAIDREWHKVKQSKICSSCKVCIKSCPTGAINKDNYLIDTNRCLTYWNESSEPFPSWIPASAHHTIFDCIKCQLSCPMNRGLNKIDSRKVCFSEDETITLLKGLDHGEQTPSFREKVAYLGLNEWPDGIPKNLEILFNINSNIHI